MEVCVLFVVSNRQNMETQNRMFQGFFEDLKMAQVGYKRGNAVPYRSNNKQQASITFSFCSSSCVCRRMKVDTCEKFWLPYM